MTEFQEILSTSNTADVLKAERDAAGLTQDEAARLLGVTGRTISRWESGGAVKDKDVRSAVAAYRDYKAGRRSYLDTGDQNAASHVAEGLPAPRFPIAALLRLPTFRAWLNAFQAELIERGATPEQEESAMRTVADRQLLARFAGGSTDDQYTEAELLQAMENIAEAARRFLSGPTL